MMDHETFGRIDKLHVLWGLALHDVRKVEADRGLDWNMHSWVQPAGAGVCNVCLAGAIAVFSLGWERDCRLNIPEVSLGQDVGRRLRAVDYLRCGNVQQAYQLVYGRPRFWADVPGVVKVQAGEPARRLRWFNPFGYDGELPWTDWEALGIELREEGL